ncbi:YcfA-like protein [compost metagenome]
MTQSPRAMPSARTLDSERGRQINVVYSCVVCIITHMNSADLIKQLKADGWYHVHTVGSHHQFKHPTKPGKVTVPHPKKELPIATQRSILKQAGLR